MRATVNFVDLAPQSKNYPSAVSLLISCGLLTSDLAGDGVKLWAAEADGHLVGVVGIEHAGDIGLLRSLAVSKDYQGLGIAKSLCDFVFDHVGKSNVKQLYLLTESAESFFKRLGFSEIARGDAPDSLRVTAQFSSLCPDSATVMVRG